MPRDPSTLQNAELEYSRRLELLHASEVKLKQRDTLLGYAKLLLSLSGIVMALAFDRPKLFDSLDSASCIAADSSRSLA